MAGDNHPLLLLCTYTTEILFPFTPRLLLSEEPQLGPTAADASHRQLPVSGGGGGGGGGGDGIGKRGAAAAPRVVVGSLCMAAVWNGRVRVRRVVALLWVWPQWKRMPYHAFNVGPIVFKDC